MLPRTKLPKTTPISQDDTHRLIPSKYFEEGESVLSRLGLPPAQMEHLFQLDDATNARLAGEANLLPGITVHELVFGVPQYHIINAAFTPSAEAVSRSAAIVAAFEAAGNPGVVGIEGKMYDRPHLRLAERLLARAKAAGISA